MQAITRVLGAVGRYSINGREMAEVFRMLRPIREGAASCRPPNMALLLRTLLGFLEDSGPAAFFLFSEHAQVGWWGTLQKRAGELFQGAVRAASFLSSEHTQVGGRKTLQKRAREHHKASQ